jgi:hypothetical protein
MFVSLTCDPTVTQPPKSRKFPCLDAKSAQMMPHEKSDTVFFDGAKKYRSKLQKASDF